MNYLRLKKGYILFIVLGIFLITSFFIVSDYGPNIDSQKNFIEGKVNLTYLLTRKITDENVIFNQTHGAFAFMLADASRRVFSKVLDPITARHIILPVLTSIFAAFMYFFVKKHFGASTGLVAVCALITFPYYLGHTFNNLKDIPLLTFFSLSIFSFVEWKSSNNLKYFYFFYIFLGLACSVKAYALIVPLILFLWLKLTRFEKPKVDIYPHTLFAPLLAVLIVLLFYIPAAWGIKDTSNYINHLFSLLKSVSYNQGKTGFTASPILQILHKTPLVMLFFAWGGLFLSFFELRKHPLFILLIIWLLIPIILPCSPHIWYYNSIRQFIVFLVPFSIFSAIGVTLAAELTEKILKVKKALLVFILSSIFIGTNLWNDVTTHPYQITFFNSLAGGLKGAQEKNLNEAWDYWLNSYRQAGRWLDKNAKPNATVYYLFYATTGEEYHKEILNYSLKRKDIKTKHIITLNDIEIPSNSYVLFVPIGFLLKDRDYLGTNEGYKVVHQAKSQGGEIFTIYYKPTFL